MSDQKQPSNPLHNLLRAIFGELTWSPPRWLTAGAAAAKTGSTSWASQIRANPRRSAIAGVAIVAVLAGGLWAWRWYQAQPKPVLVAFAVTAPAPTCYDCDPPDSPNPLLISFEASTAPLDRVGHTLPAKQAGVQMSPSLAGQWTWDNDKRLRFQPQADWPVGAKVSVKFDRKQFAAPQVRLQKQEFDFVTPAFAAKIAALEFHQDPQVVGNKKVVATIRFTHPVDPEKFERHVRLRMFDRVSDQIEKELPAPGYSVVYDKLKLNAYVHSAQLDVPPKAGRLQLTIEPGVQAARGGNATATELTSSVTVPGLNSLKIADISLAIARDERNEPNQVLLVNASFSVSERELPGKVHAWLLPLKHPDAKLQQQFERQQRGRPFQWTAANFRPEVLNAKTQLELTAIPGEREHYELHSFRYSADPGRQVYVRVDAGLKSFGGYVLGEAQQRILRVPEFPRELSILTKGALLSLSGEKTLSLFGRNVPAMRIEVGRLLPRQLQHLVTQTSGNFETPSFHNWAFDAANITERFVKTVTLPKVAPGKPQYEALDLSEYLDARAGAPATVKAGTSTAQAAGEMLVGDTPNEGRIGERRGIFLLRVQAWDPRQNRPLEYTGDNWNDARNGSLSDARLIVVTDLGLVVKRAVDGSQDVFVQSISTGMPVAGASVDIIGRNGLPVLTETTAADGHVRFPGLKSFQRERQPVLYLARQGSDSSFLPFDERGRSLDVSRFEVGGVESSADRGALSAYLFSDRGIYRPGEEIHAAAIVRSQDWSRKFEGVPLRLEITDPRGTVIRRETFTAGAGGLGEIRHQTKESSPTGTYTLALSVVRNRNYGDLIGSTTVQVRDFQPDRLRMTAGFSAQSADGWVSPDDLEAHIQLQNLFGTPAENRRISAQMTLRPAFPAFRGYPDYQFYDPQYAKEGFSEQLADATTDAQGNATLPLNLQRFARATYRLHLIAQGFEADGGRGVTSEAAQLVSSMPYLVGYKADGELGYLKRGGTRSVDLIAIDPQARRTAADDLKLARLEIRYVSVLMRQPNGTYKYESRRKESTLEETALSIAATGHTLQLATDAPGNFAYVLRDPEGQQLARIDYQVAGEGNVTRAMEKNAELELSLAKKDYAPGEEVEISMRAPYEGAGLITIERERVYAWQWFKTSTTSSIQRIKLPPGLEGNAYVSVTFVRDPGSSEIYTSPLSYGVQSFSIDVDARRNPVTVAAPALVKPGQTLTLRYHTQQPARIVLFAVDEGILQVAAYKTPDPLGHFFQKRALEVTTTQILDLILPEFRHLGLSAAPGGDAEGLLGKHLNPFRRKGEKPVAYWSGILDADSTPREVQYTVPDYFNGTLRVMAVAVADDRIGVHDSRTLVRGDFVLSPNAPTTVTPGDEFDVSVGVSNNVEGSGANAQVAVTLATDSGLEVVGEATQQAAIAAGREGSVRFRLRARDELGPSVLKFSTRIQGAQGVQGDAVARASARRQIDLSIRPATPFMTQLTAGVLEKGQRDVPVTRTLYPQHRTMTTGISTLPLQFAHGFVSYLANYPYACTEQIVSQAMPAVLLASRPEFGYVKAEPGADLAGLISELRSRQNDAGAYRLWPGSSQVIEFVSLYSQHLLIEAAERGAAVPGDLLANGNNSLRSIAARDGNNLSDERQSAYAIYLLTRQGQRMSAEIAAQRKRLSERYRGQWEQDLTAGWLAAALRLMKLERDAEQLISGLKFTASTSTSTSGAAEVYYDPMTRDALLLFITARHFPERLRNIPAAVMATLAQRVTEGYYHSLSAGTTLLALDAYAKASEGAANNFSIAEVLQNKAVRTLTVPHELFPQVPFTDQAAALRFGNHSGLNAYYLVSQAGFDRSPPTEAIKHGLEVIREYTDADGKPLTRLTMGQEVNVHLKFRGLKARDSKDDYIGNIALVDLLPGGFELVVPSQAATSAFAEASAGNTGEGSGNEQGVSGQGNQGDGAERSGTAVSRWHCQVCVGPVKAMLQYADMREDRVVFYVAANRDVQEIVYRIKATNVGNYTVPPAYGEAMYDRSVIARSTASKLTVERPQQ